MPAYKINKTTGNPDTLIAGGTLYADTPIGTIISSGAAYDNPPAGYLFCGGQAISRTTYAALFAVIGTSFGAGDGSTTFNVPELRGEFLRGAGTNHHAGQGNGGAPGFHQDATTIPYTYANNGANNINFAGNGTTQNIDSVPTETNYFQTMNSDNHGTASSYNFGTVRPTNTSVNFFIKATNIAVPSDFMSAVDEAISDVTDLIPASASPSNKLVTDSDIAKRKNVTVTATASIENDIKALLDTLITETSGTYIGSFTRTGNTSGYYSVSVSSTWNVMGIVSICGAASEAYRVAKFKNTAEGAYTYEIARLVTEDEALEVKTLSPTVLYTGTSITAVRSGKSVMMHVHIDSVPVSGNVRVALASGLPIPAGNIIPIGFTDWGGMSTTHNVEINTNGDVLVVGAPGTSSTNVTVDSTVTYITSN